MIHCKLNIIQLRIILICGCFSGTYKVRNEIETKRNEINENETKRNETKWKRNETKPTKAKRKRLI
jgi:hypothetical protein